jgi:putative serine protease PepD
MTDDPRYSAPQQPGQGVPNQQGVQGYSQPGYQQPYDWRYGSPHIQNPHQAPQPPFDPYRSARAGTTSVLPPVVEKPRRKRSRSVALTAGALAIAAVSAGIGGAVATVVRSEDHPVSTGNTAIASAPDRSAVPTANVPVGSVEQVAAKVVPSVVKLETKWGGHQKKARASSCRRTA